MGRRGGRAVPPFTRRNGVLGHRFVVLARESRVRSAEVKPGENRYRDEEIAAGAVHRPLEAGLARDWEWSLHETRERSIY